MALDIKGHDCSAIQGHFRLTSMLAFLRTLTGTLIGSGIPVFVLTYWKSNFYSGLSISAIAITYIFSPVVFGNLSDRIGRKKSLLIATTGNLLLACLFFSCNFFILLPRTGWLIIFILVLRGLEGMFNGFFWPILQSNISDLTLTYSGNDAQHREELTRKGIGVYNLGWNGGILTGGLLLSLLLSFDRLDLVLTVPMVSNCINLFLVVFLFAEQKHYLENNKKQEISKEKGASRSNGFKQMLQGNKLLPFGITYILFYGFLLGIITTTTTNLYKFKDIAMLIGITDSLRIAFQAASSSKIRFNQSRILLKVTGLFASLIGIFFTLVLGTIFFSPVAFLVIYPVLGFVMGIIYTEAMAIMVADKDDKKKGFLMGIFESMIGIGFFLGPLIAGYITEYYSYVLSYTTGLLSIFVLFLGSLCIKVIYKYKR